MKMVRTGSGNIKKRPSRAHFLKKTLYFCATEHRKVQATLIKIGGAVCCGIGGGLILSSLCFLGQKTPTATLCMDGIGLVTGCVGIGLIFGANSCYNKAIDIYNSTYDHAAIQLNFFAGNNGVGLALNF